jgi:hypothetical protein
VIVARHCSLRREGLLFEPVAATHQVAALHEAIEAYADIQFANIGWPIIIR